MRKTAFVIAASLLVGGSAVPAKYERNKVPEAVQTGDPVSCIQITQIRESRVRSDKVIDFRAGGKKWYRNTLPHSCPSLGFEEKFLYSTSLSQLCNVDIITVLHNYGSGIQRGASCGLGTFTPVELPKKAK